MKKKILSMVLVGFMSLSMVACGGKEEPKEEIDTTTEQGGPVNRGEMMEEAEKNVPENMEDGYEMVDSINIDGGTTKLTFNRSEKYTLQGGEEVLACYFNFENISAGETSVHGQYNFRAYQNGVEITVYSTTWEETEQFENASKYVLDGATMEIAIAIEPDDWTTPIKLRVDNEMAYDLVEETEGKKISAQQQEIVLE